MLGSVSERNRRLRASSSSVCERTGGSERARAAFSSAIGGCDGARAANSNAIGGSERAQATFFETRAANSSAMGGSDRARAAFSSAPGGSERAGAAYSSAQAARAVNSSVLFDSTVFSSCRKNPKGAKGPSGRAENLYILVWTRAYTCTVQRTTERRDPEHSVTETVFSNSFFEHFFRAHGRRGASPSSDAISSAKVEH